MILSETTDPANPVDWWWIETESIYDHDTGDQWLRITHTLVMDVAADDIVSFELSF